MRIGGWLIAMTMAAPALAEPNPPVQEELESVRGQIRIVEEDLGEARDQTAELRRALQDNERKSAAAVQQLHSLQGQIAEQQKHADALAVRHRQRRATLQKTEQALARQLRAAWELGRYSTIRLLLNQESPERVGRMLAFHAWQGRRRKGQIQSQHRELRQVLDLQAGLDAELLTLDDLREQQQKRLQDYQVFRSSREVLRRRLQAHIQAQETRLQELRENERELQALFERLEGYPPAPSGQQARLPVFTSLKGRLDWPLPGRLLKRFGQDRLVAGGPLKWSGVLIAAAPGETVHTIGTGQVIYAEPFRGLDQLLIIDHGGGYMSLYGYNKTLLKKKGDWVLAGERIALVGDGAGRRHSGLYFEVREDGMPVNPAAWCRNR